MIIQNEHGLGQESVFEFKYIPEFHTTTELGESEEVGLKQLGVERRNLKTLIVAILVMFTVIYFSIRVAVTCVNYMKGTLLPV